MCGIIGIVGKNAKNFQGEKMDSMLSSLSCRGPDDKGIDTYDNCLLGHTRLSIIDIHGGHQPMKDSKEPLSISFNGEIYNYKELRADLEKKGYIFSTNSDTEVIIETYREYGAKCVEYLDGMFAFIIWNEKAQELFMARDRFGKKPLYYAFDEKNNLIVASEIKAILKAGVQGKIDLQALDNYLTLMYIPPWKSIYRNILALPPAHIGIFNDGKVKISQYWSLKDKPVDVSYERAKTEVKKLFDDAVRKRMVADVEIGALLSGGVDSTLVSAYAQKHLDNPLKTFSIGYGKHIDELPFAKEVAKKIGAQHFILQAKEDLVHELEEVIAYMDEPHADSSNFPQHIISRLTAEHVKVALSGDGADELFLGYGWYWKYWNTRKITRVINSLFSNPFKEHLKNISIFSTAERKALWKDSNAVNNNFVGIEVESLKGNGIKKINLFDLTTYLPGQLLTKVDRTSMMHSLEIRCPFLDYKLAEYVYNLPLEYKTDKKNGKIILKDILTEIMPKEFVYRRKQGFGAPIAAWLKTDSMKKLVYEKLFGDAKIYEFFRKEEIQKYLSVFYERNNTSVHYKIWMLLCLELWLERHEYSV